MITKRQLGIGLCLFGLLFAVAILAVDFLRAGNFVGIGPLQQMALVGALLIFLLGLTLIHLGDRPA